MVRDSGVLKVAPVVHSVDTNSRMVKLYHELRFEPKHLIIYERVCCEVLY